MKFPMLVALLTSILAVSSGARAEHPQLIRLLEAYEISVSKAAPSFAELFHDQKENFAVRVLATAKHDYPSCSPDISSLEAMVIAEFEPSPVLQKGGAERLVKVAATVEVCDAYPLLNFAFLKTVQTQDFHIIDLVPGGSIAGLSLQGKSLNYVTSGHRFQAKDKELEDCEEQLRIVDTRLMKKPTASDLEGFGMTWFETWTTQECDFKASTLMQFTENLASGEVHISAKFK